ncbi:MAG: hypothetical protein JWP81_392 [Ferruginibacter sp.]|nr:hypothetical protein [Ferruginibacter sp.]
MLSSHSNFLWLLILPIFAFTPQSSLLGDGPKKTKIIKWAVQKTSTIGIQGSTNVNDFGCEINGYYQQDTIFCSEESAANKMVTLNGALQVDILKFDCHNKMLTGDLRKTLKANEYPKLVIRFLSLERAPLIQNNKDFLKGWVEVELAGSRRKFEVCYSFIKTGASSIRLNGKRAFSFSDFKLTPPKKFMGMVKVNDKFNVDFNLLLNPVE